MEGDGLLAHFEHGADAFYGQVDFLRHFLRGGFAAKILHELFLHAHELVDRLDHVHRNAVYDDPGRLLSFRASRQINLTAASNSEYFSGSEGICGINGSSKRIVIKKLSGRKKWRYQPGASDMYQVEHDEFFASIREGGPINDGERMASSTLLSMVGRIAADTGQGITWDMAFNSKERLVPRRWAGT